MASYQKLKFSTRILSFLMCVFMLLSMFCVTVSSLGIIVTDNADNSTYPGFDSNNSGHHELYPPELVKLAEEYHVLYRIMYEGLDPYNANMTIDEFYELMELFQSGVLPLQTHTFQPDVIANSIVSNIARPNIDNDTQFISNTLVPRTMFLFNGLTNTVTGSDTPLPYPPAEDEDDFFSYPDGLDTSGLGYMRPPISWDGVSVEADNKGQLVVAVIVKNENDNDPTIAGNVNQTLFPAYDEYYVNKVTAEGVETSILGVIEKSAGEYVYFYMSSDDQNTQVSSTTLAEGQKFIVHYWPKEYAINYQVILDDVDVTEQWVSYIFGDDRLDGTVGRRIGFDAHGPYFYETEILFYPANGADAISLTKTAGTSTQYPLGREITYRGTGGFQIIPDTSNGPNAVYWQDTFNLTDISCGGTITAILSPKPTPQFNAGTILKESNGSGGANSGSSRGANATPTVTVTERATGQQVTVPYDYEDESIFRTGGQSKYIDYPNNGNWPNVINYEPSWTWNDNIACHDNMRLEEDGTYSFSWTFQSNSGGFMLDSLEINGVTIDVPYVPKYNLSNKTLDIVSANDYYREVILPDGVIARVEYLSTFSNSNQRVYRVTVVGAKSEMVVTALNMMMYNTGAEEFIPNGLEGIYADDAQNATIEYYSVSQHVWIMTHGGGPVIREIDYPNGSPAQFGANIRFKLKDGYSSPYFYFRGDDGLMIGNNYSITVHEDGTLSDRKAVQPMPTSGKLEAGYIYGPDENGWYYIRLTDQNKANGSLYKFAGLTINARAVKYAIQYVPNMIPEYSYEDSQGQTVIIPEHMPANMPTFMHSAANNCHPSFWDGREQYDDYNGVYYDVLAHYDFIVSSTIPTDIYGYYKFTGWALLDTNGNIVDGSAFMNDVSININSVKEYAVIDDSLGGEDIDIAVVQFIPIWQPLRHPFKYSVVLDWIDAQGVLHQEHFSDYWQDILTESPEGDNSLTVFVNTAAGPLLDWIAQHPTYTFWDEVNNVVDGENATTQIESALDKAIPSFKKEASTADYQEVLNALLNRTQNGTRAEAFSRLGGYAFQVHEDGGRIVIWMYENKGGLMFHEDVQQEAFITDEEFFFTVDHVQVGNGTSPLNNTYKAYPEHVYNEDGTERDVKDSDAWLVKFEDGKIVNITKNGTDFPEEPVTYFALKHGEGIMLYVPDGNYTITQLGSKSGGKYKVAVEYDGDISDDDQDGWEIPDDDDLWIKGSLTTRTDIMDKDTLMQVSAKVQFAVGEANVVHTIIFHDRTSSLSIQKNIISPHGDSLYNTLFTFRVLVLLPDGDTPLYDADNDIYYYVVHRYDKDGKYNGNDDEIIILSKLDNSEELDGTNIWEGTIQVQGGWHSTIVMQVLKDDINYYVEEIIPANPTYKLFDKANERGKISSGELKVAIFWNTDFDPGLTITETVIGPSALVDDTVFYFDIVLTNSDASKWAGELQHTIIYIAADGTAREETITFINGVASIQLRNGESATIKSLLADSQYTVTQGVAMSSDGRIYRVSSQNGSGYIPQEDTTIIASFENALPVSMTVSKVVSGTAGERNKEFQFTLILSAGKFGLPSKEDFGVDASKITIVETGTGYVITFALKDGDTITFDNIPYLTEYDLSEQNDDYITKIVSSLMGTLTGNTISGALEDIVSIRYENQRENGSLTISKQVEDPENQPTAGTGYGYIFSLTLSAPAGAILQEDDCIFTLYTNRTPQALSGHIWTDNSDGTVTVTFTLMHGQSLNIAGLPPGTLYVLEETDAGKYVASYSETNGQIIANTSSAVSVTNTLDDNNQYQLVISKEVAGIFGNRMTGFRFTIRLTDKAGTPYNGVYTFSGSISDEWNAENPSLDFENHLIHFINGEATVWLMHGEMIVLERLPEQSDYTVEETNANKYYTTVSVTTGTSKSEPITTKSVNGKLTANVLIEYLNVIDGIVPTDATNVYTWLFVIMSVASAGLFATCVNITRKRHQRLMRLGHR